MSIDFNSQLFSENDKIVIGVSGGIDSVVLLHLLVAEARSKKMELIVAHLHHGIRGDSADSDAEFVKNFTEIQGLEYRFKFFNVPNYAKEHGLSVEEAARDCRYSFFQELSQELGASKVAVAHHKDDQVETILMRFLRGAAAKGLSGMRPSRNLGGVKLVRPLLGATKADIEHYAKEHSLQFVVDETNQETEYFRNKVRHDLRPILQNYNSNLDDSLVRMADVLAADDDFLDSVARGYLKELVTRFSNNDFIKLDIVALKSLHLALQRRVVRLAIEMLLGEVNEISLVFVENFLQNDLNTLFVDDAGVLQYSKS